jgi:ArsR family transcriptional regulator
MDRATAEDLARLLKAVADPARLQLLALVRSSESGESCVCDLTAPLGLSQPTVSHHLKVLTDAGLLTRERRGTWAWYTLVPERLAEISAAMR